MMVSYTLGWKRFVTLQRVVTRLMHIRLGVVLHLLRLLLFLRSLRSGRQCANPGPPRPAKM